MKYRSLGAHAIVATSLLTWRAAAQEAPIEGAEAAAAAGWGDLSSLAEQTGEQPVFQTKLYGFIDSYWEKVAKTPDSVGADGETVYEQNGHEFDVLNFNAMLQGAIYNKYRFFFNLAAPGAGSNTDDEGIGVRNAWVEIPIVPGYLTIRAGKTYRRFGLYNEILDAVPTFIGIEAPELFDKDHLMLTRTTNLMVHGSADVGAGVVTYAVFTGNDERTNGAIPIGADLRLDLPFGLKLGSSYYTSGGDAAPSRAVGEGSPRGGVANWMEVDQFSVAGGYAQLMASNFIIQAEYWRASHKGTRDEEAVLALAEGRLNTAQLNRFFVGGDPTAGARLNANYKIHTAYIRAGYEITTGELSSMTPYLQADFYSNPESVKSKSLGGDNEAGLSDDGKFTKLTAGVVVRPVTQVAFKLDASGHQQDYNGKSEFYPEVRASLSYLWELNE